MSNDKKTKQKLINLQLTVHRCVILYTNLYARQYVNALSLHFFFLFVNCLNSGTALSNHKKILGLDEKKNCHVYKSGANDVKPSSKFTFEVKMFAMNTLPPLPLPCNGYSHLDLFRRNLPEIDINLPPPSPASSTSCPSSGYK